MTTGSRCLGAATALVLLLGLTAHGDVELPAPFNGPVQHSRSIPVDFLNVRVELSFDWQKESIQARATHTFRSFHDNFRTLVLDAVDITFLEVFNGKGDRLKFQGFDDRIEIQLAEPLSAGEKGQVSISYRCRPEQGIYFVSPIPEYPDRTLQVWTQGEQTEARYWLPCFDSPAERLASELILTVPEQLSVLANGKLQSDRNNGDGTRTVHWVQEQEHVVYLICFAAGVYEKLTDSWDGIPIASWHYPGDRERAERSFHLTADMMKLFSEKFGRYPWVKYDQIVVRDFMYGGMENTTATVLTDRTLHLAKDEPNTSSRGLVAHELAHQWFGDLVTCRDWSDIWLNESFASFCAPLYTEHHLGRPDAQMERLGQAESYFSEDKNDYRRPLYCRTYENPDVMFDSHTYPMGARILEMLRQHLGDQDFFRGVRSYLERHKFQSVETAQFRRAMEDSTGESLGWFFDQWVHHGGYPELKVTQESDAEGGRLTLKVRQTQSVDSITPLFQLPVTVGIHYASGQIQEEKVRVEKEEQSFSFQLSARPSFVRFDQHSVLLMQLD
ncbi:MAG: M1 family aminopeptidase, partial [Planctomycetota bacterium]